MGGWAQQVLIISWNSLVASDRNPGLSDRRDLLESIKVATDLKKELLSIHLSSLLCPILSSHRYICLHFVVGISVASL